MENEITLGTNFYDKIISWQTAMSNIDFNDLPKPIYYGFLMNEKMYDIMIESINPTTVEFGDNISWGGMIIGIHKNIPEGIVIPVKTKEEYMYVYGLAEFCPEKLIEELEKHERKE